MNYTGIPITVHWLEQSAKLANPDITRTVPFQIVLPGNATSLGADGSAASITLIGLARDSHGQDAARFAKKLGGNLTPESARRIALAGMKFDSSMQLAPGYYDVRFVVRDNLSGRIGSVTAPVVVK
jgi:hypothetical protein